MDRFSVRRCIAGGISALLGLGFFALAGGRGPMPAFMGFAVAAASGDAIGPLPGDIRLATFDVDATPPLGSEMAYDPVKGLSEMTLRCRGMVLLGAQEPIVLCAVDWIGIANEGQDAFRVALAEAAETTPERVAVQTLHQHDAPGCDFTAERLVSQLGLKDYGRFEGGFHRQVIKHAAEAVRQAGGGRE